MRKIIMLMMDFDDNFMPPKKVPYEYESCDACKPCPFYHWDDDYGTGFCECCDAMTPEDVCPLRRFFE